MSESKNSEWVGIDLGTTNTVAAVYIGGNQHSGPGYVEVIYMTESNGTLTDSCVFFDQESDVLLFGKQAANEKAQIPENTICDSKRLMGLAFSEDPVSEFQRKIRHSGRTIRKTPIEIAAKVLEKIREAADEWANGDVKFGKAVITVPLKFGQEQLVGTIRAAKLAGFSEVHLIKEPNAAAFFYGFKHLRLDGYTILVLDFGGGTLNVSILKVQNGEFEALASKGKKWLGGRDLDMQIRREMVKRIKAEFGYDCTHCRECRPECNPETCPRAKRDMQVLLERCERLKINLSTQRKSNISLDFIGLRGQIQLTREEYEELVKEELNEVIETVNETMEMVGLNPAQIQQLQMTGGSSCTPVLADMLEEIGFARDKIERLEPMHSVAKGAAIVGAQLDEQMKSQLPTMNLVEICPLSIGIKTMGGLFDPIIRRGTKIPCSEEKIYHTAQNDQRSVSFDIYEGERKLALENNKLGSFTLYNLPNGAAGDVEPKLKLTIDRDGILHAEATHKGKIAILDADYKEKRIDSDKVDQMIPNSVRIFLDGERIRINELKEGDLIDVFFEQSGGAPHFHTTIHIKNFTVDSLDQFTYPCDGPNCRGVYTTNQTIIGQGIDYATCNRCERKARVDGI